MIMTSLWPQFLWYSYRWFEEHLRNLLTNYKASWVDSNTLGAMISFIDSDKTIGQLKHVIPEAAYEKEKNKYKKRLKHGTT